MQRRGSLLLLMMLIPALSGCVQSFLEGAIRSKSLIPLAPKETIWESPYAISTSESPRLTWIPSTDPSIVRYEVAMGTTPGGSDVSPWQSAGLATTHTFSGVSLANGQAYYASVRAISSTGHASAVVVSSNLAVITDSPTLNLDFTTVSTLHPMIKQYRGGGVPGTYVDSAGIVRTAAHNVLLRSEAFDQAEWIKTSTTVTTNAAISQNLSLSAERLREVAANATHTIAQSYASIVSGTTYTLSFYVKPDGRTEVGIALSNTAFAAGPFATFDIQNGTVLTSGGGVTSTAIQNVDNGWYRVSITATAGASGAGTATLALLNGGASTYIGSTANGVYLGGGQLEAGTVPTLLITTGPTTAGGARFDHDPSSCVAGVCALRGLLLEGSRTNLALQSATFTNAAWTKSNVTPTAAATTGPDAALSATQLKESSDGSPTVHEISQAGLAVTASTRYSATVYVKANGRSRIVMKYYRTSTTAGVEGTFDLVAKTATAAKFGAATVAEAYIQPMPSDWYRLELVGQVSTVATTGTVTIQLADATTTSYAGDGTSGVYLWGAQFESGGRASSYIPTTTAARSRAGDNMNIDAITSWASTSSGTLYVQGRLQNDDPTANHWPLAMRLCLSTDCSNAKNEIQFLGNRPAFAGTYTSTITNYYNLFYSLPHTTNMTYRLMYAFDNNDFRAAANGTLGVADSSGTIVGPDAFRATGETWIRKITYWPNRLTDTQIEAYTK